MCSLLKTSASVSCEGLFESLAFTLIVISPSLGAHVFHPTLIKSHIITFYSIPLFLSRQRLRVKRERQERAGGADSGREGRVEESGVEVEEGRRVEERVEEGRRVEEREG